MNNEQKQLLKRIEEFSLDKPDVNLTFSQRLARENNWSIDYTHKVIKEYKKFIFLAVVAGHVVTPSEQIDQVWHLHLTYTRSYWDEFCLKVLQQTLHHRPTEGGQSENVKYDDLYRQTLNSYQKFFANSAPQDIWSSPHIRFGKDLDFKRINTQENWIIPKPNISFIIESIIHKTAKFNKTTTLVVSIFLIILITLGNTLPGLAENTPFYWDFLNINLDIQENGDLLVTEEQKYVFKDSHSPQRYRFINLDSIKAIKDVQVFEDNHLLPIETAIKGNKFWIEWQDYLDNHNVHTFVLKYRAIGAVVNKYGADRLDWKAIFPKRQSVINNSEITVNFPKSLVGKLKTYYAAGGNFKSDLIDNSAIKFTSLQSLSPGESASIKLIFPGNSLNFEPFDLSLALKTMPDFSENVVGYFIVGVIFMIFAGMVILFLFLFVSAITGNLPKGKSNSSGGWGGCSGGCSSGCGGGG
ncbi:MAG: DUF2207 domain-containing protein [Cyanobacteria bacterium P01_G01_bin.39]